MDVKFTPSGRRQFLAALETIRKENGTAARQFRRWAEKALERLERFPASGAVVAEFPDFPHREVYVEPYRFFYRVNDKTVWVVAVWHGAQISHTPEDASDPRDV
jgi:plasmid stabilization system protein ParE